MHYAIKGTNGAVAVLDSVIDARVASYDSLPAGVYLERFGNHAELAEPVNALLYALNHAEQLPDAEQLQRLLVAVKDGLTLAQLRQAEAEFNVENVE